MNTHSSQLYWYRIRRCNFRILFNFPTNHAIICSNQWLFTLWLSRIFASKRWWTILENSNLKESSTLAKWLHLFCRFTQLNFDPLPTICQVLCRTSWVMAFKVGHFTTMSNLHFPIHQLNLSEPFLLLLGYAILTKSFSLKAMRLFFPQLLSIRILFNPIKKCYCNHSWNRKGASLFWVLDSGAASL